ncbi:MAG: non-ribosomal peptide synthetase, partial [Streptomyces sp.]|nr:non-ribosomal peptide synthetase [Streptomyces sp.]
MIVDAYDAALAEDRTDAQRAVLTGAAHGERRSAALAYLRQLIARVDPEVSDSTGDDDPLFLQSIAAAEVRAVTERDLGVSIPFSALFDGLTLGAIADLLVGEFENGVNPDAMALPAFEPDPAGQHEPFPLTDVQHAYWLGRSGLFEMSGVSTHLYMEFASADFDPELAAATLEKLIRRHDMLRAVVTPDGSQRVLTFAETEALFAERRHFRVEDLRGAAPVEAESRVARVRRELSHEVRPADQWPLFEVRAQLLPDGTARLHLSVDLLIADAGSIQILLGEWAVLYADPEAELPGIGVTFRDYVRALAAVEGSEAFRRAEAYWRGRIAELPPAPELPVVTTAPDGPPTFTRRQFSLDADSWNRLKRRSLDMGVTPSGVVCAAFGEVLGRWSKGSRFTLNVTVADRLPVHADVQRVVGDFTSLVLLEVDGGAGESFRERARVVQGGLWEALEHRAYGGVRVLRDLAREYGAARASMPVVFTSAIGHEMGGAHATLPGLGQLASSVSQTPQVYLDHQIYEQADGLAVSWDAVDALFPEGMLDDAFAAYEALLRRLATDQGSWDSADPAELPQRQLGVRKQANATDAFVPETLLHQAVADSAERRPDQTAVVSVSGVLSYGEVVSRARRVGRVLRELG